MLRNTYTYILIKILALRNPYLFLTHVPLIQKYIFLKYSTKNFFFFVVTKYLFTNNIKKMSFIMSSPFMHVEAALKNSIGVNKPIYFLPIDNNVADINLINIYLNNFKPTTNIYLLMDKRKYKNVKRLVINSYSPSLLICMSSFQNFKIISNIKLLKIPTIGLVDKSIIHNPFDINICVPSINPYFQVYYFLVLFKLIVYYKKLYIRSLIHNFMNFKLIYLKKLWLLK